MNMMLVLDYLRTYWLHEVMLILSALSHLHNSIYNKLHLHACRTWSRYYAKENQVTGWLQLNPRILGTFAYSNFDLNFIKDEIIVFRLLLSLGTHLESSLEHKHMILLENTKEILHAPRLQSSLFCWKRVNSKNS